MLHRFIQVTAIAAAIVVSSGCGGLADEPSASTPSAAVSSGDAGETPRGVAPVVSQRGLPAASAPGGASLAEQVALLRREVAEMRLQLARMPGTGRAEPDPPRIDASPEARAEAEQAERMRIATSESAFRNEPDDTRWSRSTVESVRGAFLQGEVALRDELRSVECRSRSCRVELNVDAAVVGVSDLPGRLLGLAQTFPNVTTGEIDQGNGRKATVLYLSR